MRAALPSTLLGVSFFDLPPAAVDRIALDTFLAERLPESLNLDYKRELSESVFDTVAAMANTYGGVIIVGVNDDPAEVTRPLLPPVGVDPADRERLVNQSYTRFQPPFAPDVIPVPLESGSVVLVIRVDTRRAARPVVLTRRDEHKVLIRLETRNAPADRYRMAALFAEGGEAAAVVAGSGNWTLQHGQKYPLDELDRPALTARVAVEAQIPVERLDVAVIDTTDRRELAAALEHAPITEWLSLQVGKWADSWSSSLPVEKAYSNLSSVATLKHRSSFDTGQEAPFVGQASLLLPAGTHVGSGRLTLLLDAAFDPDPVVPSTQSPSGNPPRRPRLSLEDVYRLIRALLDSALDVAAPAVFPRILGVPVWERIGPTAYLHTFQSPNARTGLGHFIQLDSYVGRTQPNFDLSSATFALPRMLGVEDAASRSEVVKQWLTRLLLDMGVERFEDDLAAFD